MAILQRETNQTRPVRRIHGKIALEEAVDSPAFNAGGTTPASNMITGDTLAIPFREEIIKDVGPRLSNLPERLRSMDQSGVGYSIVSCTAPGVQGIADASMAAECARKTNDATYEKYVKPHPDRFGFLCCVSMHDGETAAKELERSVTQLGAVGALVNGFQSLDSNDWDHVRYLDEETCEPFLAMLAKLDVPVYLHPRSPPPGQQRLYHGYPMLAQASYGFGSETAGHALRIMCSGLFDRYPNVQMILGHAAEALPFLIHRVDHRMWISPEGANGPHKHTMMHYFQNNVYATLAGVRRASTLRCTLDELGEQRVMFSIDYPYESNEEASDWFDALEMNENTRNALAFGNAKRLFKLK